MRRCCAVLVLVGLAVGVLGGQEPLEMPKNLPGGGAPGVAEPYLGSNLILVASHHLLNGMMARTNESTEPISDEFEGNQITGISHSQSSLGVELQPCEDRGALNLVVNGVIHGRTTSRSSQFPVTLHNQGVVTFQARKPVFIEESGVTWLPTKVCARARSELLWVDTDIKHDKLQDLLKQFAAQRYYSTKPRAEKHQAERAEERVGPRTDEQTEPQLANLNNQLQERLASLREGGLSWSALMFKSTPLALRAAFLAAEAANTPAKVPPPEAPWPADLSFRAHQAALNEVARARYHGKTMTGEELAAEMRGFLGSGDQSAKPPDKKDGNAQDPPRTRFKIEFTDLDPVAVEAKDSRLTITLNAKAFTPIDAKGVATDKPYKEIEIAIKYEIQNTPTGPRLKRDGAPAVKTHKPGAFAVGAVVEIKLAMEDLFKGERVLPPLNLPGNMARVGPLRPTHAGADNGWLVLGYER